MQACELGGSGRVSRALRKGLENARSFRFRTRDGAGLGGMSFSFEAAGLGSGGAVLILQSILGASLKAATERVEMSVKKKMTLSW